MDTDVVLTPLEDGRVEVSRCAQPDKHRRRTDPQALSC